MISPSFPFEISSGFIQVGLVDSWIWLQIRSGRNGQNAIISGSSQERRVSTVNKAYMVQCANSFWKDMGYSMSQTYFDTTTCSLLAPTCAKGTTCISGPIHVSKTRHSTCPPFWPNKHDAIRLQNTPLILAARSGDFHDFLKGFHFRFHTLSFLNQPLKGCQLYKMTIFGKIGKSVPCSDSSAPLF